MTQVHKLKTIGTYFDAVKRGEKTFDVRKNDRGFQTGDILELQRLDEKGFYTTGSGGIWTTVSLRKRITYILQGGQFGILPAYCVLGLGDVEEAE
jgi:hypothetical protein